MGLTFNLGRVSPSVFTDSSLNVGIGAAPSGSYKLEVTGTAKVSSTLLVSGAATFSSNVNIIDYSKVTGAGPWYSLFDTQSSSKNWAIRVGHDAVGDFAIRQSNSTGGDPVASGTTRFYINNSGNVGIGTSSPSSYGGYLNTTLQATGASGVNLDFKTSAGTREGVLLLASGTEFSLIAATAIPLTFRTTDTKRMQIYSSGEVAIIGAAATEAAWGLLTNDANTGYFNIFAGGSGTATKGIKLKTTTGSTTLDAMTITSGGDVILQYSKSIAFNSISNQYITADASGLYLGTANLSRLNINTSGVVTITAIGTGTVTATSGVLSAVSDMNLKIEDGFVENALEKVMNLKPRYFLWKEESGLPTDLRQLGFYAQEVNEALGEEVANTPKDENQNWGIYDRGMIAMLTKAMQEQNEVIEDLKSRLDKAGL